MGFAEAPSISNLETENRIVRLNIISNYDELCINPKDNFNIQAHHSIMFKTVRLRNFRVLRNLEMDLTGPGTSPAWRFLTEW